MGAMATSLDVPAGSGTLRSAWERWFGGFTWKGFALVVLLCLLNAIRRKIQPLPEEARIADWAFNFAFTAVIGLLIAVPVALAVVATCNRIPAHGWRRYVALSVAVIVSSLLGTVAMVGVEWQVFGYPPQNTIWGTLSPIPTFLLQFWLRYAMLAALFTAAYVYSRTADERAAQAFQARVDRERLEAQLAEARFSVLQAQIEPHFLFNTLATVRRLYRTAPHGAVAMLDNLMRYLGVALPQMRASVSTLGREATLAEAYLDIQKLRMGRRLAFEIDVPESLREVPVPPMMLLTLVENAIKHGLNPLPEGGFVRVDATAEGDCLRVQVSDSGQGFVRTSGGGTGLANIRARLAALHGRAASLDLGLNRPRGVTATLTLPIPQRAFPASA